ncbi:ABC transporter ATP-binding protein [Vagococcus sp.]|uniref:ABC transporter ATP-binding protein n=1 Tax=Vagococcus sp. TaxID=1933889 RepID=UPI003F9B80C0
MLKLQKISKSFGATAVLEDISLEIETGEVVSILGASGSGKTTLLNIILGLENVSSGQLFFNDEEITKINMEHRPFNIVFQDYALFPNLNAYENLTYGLKRNKGLTNQSELEELIQLLDLEKHLNKPIQQLSGGQKQRVALGRTLVMKPKVLLLDEPLSALDGVIKESIKERIKTIAKTLNLTTIIVTHDPEEALTMSDKILVLNNGQVAQFSTPDEIVSNVGNQFVKHLIVDQLEIKRLNIQKIFDRSLKAVEVV